MNIQKIETMIYTIRGQKVMLDSDLAKLYGVETKKLNQAVKRNIDRFPEDFLIVPNSRELAYLRSQIVTLGDSNSYNYVFKHTPHFFSEYGVAMLSSVLRSKSAIQINISIMRTFTKLRSYLAMDNSSDNKINELGESTSKLFKVVFERLDNLEDQVSPRLEQNRKKIGIKSKK